MPIKLSFNQKILLAACLVVIAAVTAFSVYNDYLQRRTLQASLQTYLNDAGALTADNISGRILLLETWRRTCAASRLSEITHGIGEIDNMNQSVAAATQEQTSVIENLNVDITEINTLNQEGVDHLQATLRACASLEDQVMRLRQRVGSCRI
ncbi:hypothetical protein GCM10007421_00700 [Halopseudomonas oceani]|nr:hypothetical protein GCM10007421_00700 [Halopseudomonas oceani]